MKFTRRRSALFSCILLGFAGIVLFSVPDTMVAQATHPTPGASYSKYVDEAGGKSSVELARAALANNAELAALRNEAEAAEALIRQARLRANPSVELSGTRQIGGADNSFMIEGSLPLELAGRRGARIRTAEAELEIRKLAVAERERQLAFEVRSKYAEALAAALKLKFTEEMLADELVNFDLVSAQVGEGRRPPLEQNMESVELNRIRAARESGEASVEMKMLELRNLVGMTPEEPLRIRNEFEKVSEAVPPRATATETAIQRRPDLAGARAVERLAAARISQARSEGRIDADVMVGYQRMRSGFPLLGIEEATGALLPIDSKFQFFTFGVKLTLPVRDRNQGMIAAATLESEAARNRREFGELSVRRDVATAYVRYERALRAKEIYRVGVRDQAEANLNVVRQTYELGSKTLLDYVAEHHRFIEVENGYIDAMFETYTARLEILRAVNAAELVHE